MFKICQNILLLFLLAFPCTLMSVGQVFADGDPAEEPPQDFVAVDEDGDNDDDDDDDDDDDEGELVEDVHVSDSGAEDEGESESVGAEVTSHPDADTTIVFVAGEEFPASEIVKFLVGFTNKGSQDFTVHSLEASFRYPQDYQFYVQNFTALPLSTVVQPQRQATFEYSFIPAQPMAGRPFGLVILLNYQDAEGNVYQSPIYNETVTIIEREEGLDGETMFMYVFLSGLVVMILFSIFQVLESRTRKRPLVKVETGTGSLNNVDISWIPQETLNAMNKTSPRASPRKRTKRAAGTDQ